MHAYFSLVSELTRLFHMHTLWSDTTANSERSLLYFSDFNSPQWTSLELKYLGQPVGKYMSINDAEFIWDAKQRRKYAHPPCCCYSLGFVCQELKYGCGGSGCKRRGKIKWLQKLTKIDSKLLESSTLTDIENDWKKSFRKGGKHKYSGLNITPVPPHWESLVTISIGNLSANVTHTIWLLRSPLCSIFPAF